MYKNFTKLELLMIVGIMICLYLQALISALNQGVGLALVRLSKYSYQEQ